MAKNKCKDCAYINEQGNLFNTYYTCIKKRKDVNPQDDACDKFIAKEDKGYKRSGLFGYHIATTICKILGKNNNDKVYLNIKALRDEYLEKDEKYQPLLNEYDIIGPIISSYIKNEDRTKSKCIATILYNTYLTYVSNEWENKNPEKALWYYLRMIEFLKNRYNQVEQENIDKPYTRKLQIKNS